MKISGLRHFGETVHSFFKNRIEDQYPLMEDEDESHPMLARRQLHEAFFQSRARSVIGRDDVVDELRTALTEGHRGKDGVLVLGQAGLGKTSVVAKVVSELLLLIAQHRLPKYSSGSGEWGVFYHFVGSCPGSTSYDDLLRRLWHQLSGGEEEGRDTEALEQALHGLLASRVAPPIFILIDAVNQLDSPSWAWLPNQTAPQVRWLVSAIPDTDAVAALTARRPGFADGSMPVVHLRPLERDSRQEMASRWLEEYNKHLNEEQVSWAHGSCCKPTW